MDNLNTEKVTSTMMPFRASVNYVTELLANAIEEYNSKNIELKQFLSDIQIDIDGFDISTTKAMSEIAYHATIADSIEDSDVALYYNRNAIENLKTQKIKLNIDNMMKKQTVKNKKIKEQVHNVERELKKARGDSRKWKNMHVEINSSDTNAINTSILEKDSSDTHSLDVNVFEMSENIKQLLDMRKKKESLLQELAQYEGFSTDITEAESQVNNLKAQYIS